MALVSRRDRHFDDDWMWPSAWRDRFTRNWDDWPMDWPRPREVADRFRRDSDRWWRDWPSDWPRMDTIVPRFSSQLDRFDRNWRNDPFWRDLYPRWAEPIFKEGIDVKTNIVNDRNRFAVDIDTYQFKPEELQVKTLDDTLLIEGHHEDVRDPDNYTRMHFVRKYQLPPDVTPEDVVSSIDSHGRLTVEARKHAPAIDGRERSIPIESSSNARFRPGSRSSSYSRDQQHNYDSGANYRQQHSQPQSQQQSGRAESRTSNYDANYLSPSNTGNGYRNEYSTRATDTNGMRHETRREEFREEFRRSGSHSSLSPVPPSAAPPLQPILNDYQRSEWRGNSGGTSSSGYHHRAASSSSRNNDFRVETPGTSTQNNNNNGIQTLRPTDELGDRSHSRSETSTRNIRISRQY